MMTCIKLSCYNSRTQIIAKIFLTLFLLCICCVNIARAQPQQSFAQLIKKVSPVVVNISTTQQKKSIKRFKFRGLPDGQDPFSLLEDFFSRNDLFRERAPTSITLGSGFIIDPKGYIVTNNHVISDAKEIRVRIGIDGKKTYKATVVGRDKTSDLAVLKIESKKDLPFVSFGNSDDSMVGDWVLAIGNPLGLGGTVTAGIISAKARDLNKRNEFIQTDASINAGNSGGPMFNVKGQVVGINTLIMSNSGYNIGLGFAIPSNIAKPVITQLKKDGSVTRGWLGVQIQSVTEDIADSMGLPESHGALVAQVVKDSPAQKAGIRQSDIIIKFDGQKIDRVQTLLSAVSQAKIGKKAKALVIRDGKEKLLKVMVEKMIPSNEESKGASKESSEEYIFGMLLLDITESERKKYNIKDSIKNGVLIADVNIGSVADDAHLRPGDIIEKFDQESVDSVSHLKKLIKKAKSKKTQKVLILVSNSTGTQFKTISTSED